MKGVTLTLRMATGDELDLGWATMLNNMMSGGWIARLLASS